MSRYLPPDFSAILHSQIKFCLFDFSLVHEEIASPLLLVKEQILSHILWKGRKFLLVQRSSHQEKTVLPSPTPAFRDQLVTVCPGLSQRKVSCPPFNPGRTWVVGHPPMMGSCCLGGGGVMKQTPQNASSPLERHSVEPPASYRGGRIGELGWIASCSVGQGESP